MNTPYTPQKVFVEKPALHSAYTQKILSRLPGIPVEEIESSRELVKTLQERPDGIGEGKRYLLLAHDKGRSFKPFPESEQYLSCDYYTLHVAEGCDLECSYCILQAYLTNPVLTVFTNLDEMLSTLEKFLLDHPDQFFRIGTGQLADSLSLDHITGFSETLVPFFAKQKNAILELKTKSTQIERLLKLAPQGRTILSWSMNARKIQEQEEHKCASISERIQAAKTLAQSGQEYRFGFHFDPIIDYPEWEKDYGDVIEELFSNISEKHIAWISLGCLRFMPALKNIMQTRFPKSKLPLSEWIVGMDGKMRYRKQRRIEIYRKMLSSIRSYSPSTTVYLSMESPEMWYQVFGQDFNKASVCHLLDQAALKSKALV